MERARLLLRIVRRLAFASALVTSTAEARDGRVVVIDVDPRIADALVVALSPWNLTVVRAPGPTPATDLAGASARAGVLASDQHGGAVVWIAPPRPPDVPATLWVYDAQTLQLAVRPLSVSEPYDDAGAAAIALSVKTVLRASPLASPEPPLAPAPIPTESPSRVAVPSPPPSPAQPAWRLETLLGLRTPTGASADIEPRAALGASVWPAAFASHLGFGLGVQAGPGVSVGTAAFQGELREASLEATARLRARAGPRVAFELDAGPGVVLTSLGGEVLRTGTHAHALRLDPSLEVGGVADFMPSTRVGVGWLVEGSALLRFQRYALDGVSLLSGPPVIVVTGLRLSVEVD